MSERSADRGSDLKYFLVVLRRRKWIIIGVCLMTAVVAGVFSSLRSTVYQGSTQVLIERQASDQVFSNTQTVDPARNVQTEVQVAESNAVSDAAAKVLGHAPDVTIDSDTQSDVITIKAKSGGAAQAAKDADTYAKSYVDYRRKSTVDDLLSAGQQVQTKINDIDAQLAAAAAPSDTQRAALEDQRAYLVDQLGRLQVSANLANAGGAAILAESTVPSAPVSPKPLRDAALGAILGLLLGIGIAFLVDYLDDSIKVRDDLERAVGNDVPVLGEIPSVAGWKKKGGAYLVTRADPSAAAAEAYRTLRTAVEFVGLETDITRFQITSARASEGKTTTLANLAIALGRAGRRVVVVSADLRRPRIHEFFGVSNRVGLTSLLLDEADLKEVVQRVPGEPNVALLASGPPPPNPSELLASARVRSIVNNLSEIVDIVLFDSPPVLPVSDALVIAGLTDATLLVASAGESSKRGLHRSYQLLRQVNARVVGMVLNNADAQPAEYGYGYYRSADVPDLQPPKNGSANGGNGNGTAGKAGNRPAESKDGDLSQ